jgi:hypothetical protein
MGRDLRGIIAVVATPAVVYWRDYGSRRVARRDAGIG